ncbi:MAG TPA: amylo-alpha-1,6-glucosidase [Candidatus Methylomirabilis sp.]|nr:amylo-alpha-1,6-glucosidase [Candidatus Methylomirabilis sp.]
MDITSASGGNNPEAIPSVRVPGCVEFGREICGELSQAEQREWWLANGIGGYAAGTVAGSLTRRYHGLLVAPVRPPLGRVLVVAKADATLIDRDGAEWPLFTNRWQGGSVEPAGYLHIESFRLDGRMPVWRYACGGIRLEARIWMEPGANTTCLVYRLEPDPSGSSEGARLRIRLLTNARDHHSQTEPRGFDPVVEADGSGLRVVYRQGFTLHITPWQGTVQAEPSWVENLDLPVERERGLPDRDSHFSPGQATFELSQGEWAGLAVSLHRDASPDLEASLASFRARDAAVLARAAEKAPETAAAPEWIRQLLLAADGFLFARPLPGNPKGESVIAGYPWFGDWGRDTMIALSGLALATGRFESARRILETFGRFIDHGMLPNVFPGAGDVPEYNTVDAALWYIEAWRAYVEATGDLDSLKGAFPALREILVTYRMGTRYGIRMDPGDGLLCAGEPGVQLTWMDARVGDWVVTPRIGKPVEVNALWYNAHRAMADFARRLGIAAPAWDELAETIREGFRRFIDPDSGGLYDVLDGPGGDDRTLRPNQLLAVSLTHTPLDAATQLGVVSLCRRYLLTSFGLRSLAPYYREYRPHYQGSVLERDGSYHQGPVWGWLLGHYALAEFRVHGDAAAAQALLSPVRHHLADAGLGTMSEIFDGAPPHTPRGCPSQAWSVACILDAWWRLERAKGKQAV